jgi:4-hydroxybenzoate polyprenyltransferase
MMDYNYFFYASLLITITHLFFYQIKFFNSKNTYMCLKVFKSNNLVGLLIFCNILIGKF